MSRKQTSQSKVKCNHISRVKEWGFDDTHNFRATLWDCINCGTESSTPFLSEEEKPLDHSNCNYDPCFGCKAKGLQFGTGDANGRVIESGTTQKKWDAELQAYRTAREQGMQPAGTTRAHVEEAYRASETLGKAYDSSSMPKSKDINKRTAEVLKHTGMV